MASRTTALIVGASRGLGLALTEEWLKRDAHVIATVRTPSPELDALKGRYPGSLEIETVDIAEAGPVHALRKRLDGRRLDVLFINAGISKATEKTPATVDEQDFIDMMRTNALSPMRVVELYEDVVAPNGVIAVMTSELGSIAGNPGFWDLYSSSKAALNMLMKCFAARRAGDPRALLLVAPGWVRTDMGTSDAPLSIEESIPFVVETVERSRGKPGLRFIDRNGRALPW
jgi:NAD(P)-dependent dehydrogenase (short-subunit alcohol dehydrogenase family)